MTQMERWLVGAKYLVRYYDAGVSVLKSTYRNIQEALSQNHNDLLKIEAQAIAAILSRREGTLCSGN